MRNYRDLQVWSKAHNLTLDLYTVSQRFPREEMFGITSQLRRAAISIGANLAEGCGRRTSDLCGLPWGRRVNSTTICCSLEISGFWQ